MIPRRIFMLIPPMDCPDSPTSELPDFRTFRLPDFPTTLHHNNFTIEIYNSKQALAMLKTLPIQRIFSSIVHKALRHSC